VQKLFTLPLSRINTMKKTKNALGAISARLGILEYARFTEAARSAGMSRSKLANAILTDYAKRILDGEITIITQTIISKP